VARIVGTTSVVGSWRVVVSTDEATEMASTNQLFNLVLECFAFVCGVAIVSMMATIFSFVGIGGNGYLAWWGDEVSLKSFIKETGSRNIEGCVSSEARLMGFSGSRIRP